MPINVYTGLMRSGKSYEVVSEVILAAISSGRDVVTNVDGISNDLIREYLVQEKKADIDKLGEVIHVVNESVFKEDFFPYFDDKKGEHVDTIVKPGDLVCIDEAWRFWGTDQKIHKNHKSFFLEHGHFTNADTGVACDLVLMIQDMGTLNRFVKAVVAFNFRTHKKVSLGMGNTYSVTMWEGSKQVKGSLIGNWVRRYDKKIFPLYSSFKAGADGKTVNVDARQNIFANKTLWLKLVVFLLVAFFSIKNVWSFFKPAPKSSSVVSPITSNSPVANNPVTTTQTVSEPPAFSEKWRYAGKLKVNNETYVIVTNQDGRIRYESPSMFNGVGLFSLGSIDGEKVTSFSGTQPKSFIENQLK